MSLPQKGSVEKAVSESEPFGPIDAATASNPEIAASIFDANIQSVQLALKQKRHLIVGRKGSGKSAMLGAWTRLTTLSSTAASAFGVADYDYVVSLKASNEITAVQMLLARLPQLGQVGPAIEQTAEQWEELFWFRTARVILTTTKDAFALNSTHFKSLLGMVGGHESRSELIEEYFRGVVAKTPTAAAELGIRQTGPYWKKIRGAVSDFLAEQDKRALITLDCMMEYAVREPVTLLLLNGLLLCAAEINKARSNIELVVALPSEVFSHALLPRIANPIRDLNSAEYLNWTSTGLLELAAVRYKNFLLLRDPESYKAMESWNVHVPMDLMRFWNRILPDTVSPSHGRAELTPHFLLRHTQLLPRQLLLILNDLASRGNAALNRWHTFEPQFVVAAVEAKQEVLAREMFSAYTTIYPDALSVCQRTLWQAPSEISYRELERRWHKRGRPLVEGTRYDDFDKFLEMTAAIGVLGKQPERPRVSTARYIHVEFSYERKLFFILEDEEPVFVHPLFHSLFQIIENTSAPIFPVGALWDAL